ncbi:MAG: xylulokinase, partial [Spirochaetales bacterium]|nr:xylulokinase [Spirochaetales bacterium]
FKAKEIKLIGGGSNSPLWRQMASDVCNLPVKLPSNPEAAAFGAALQAFMVLEGKASISEIVKDYVLMDEAKTCHPDPSSVKVYKQSYRSWLDSVVAMGPLF